MSIGLNDSLIKGNIKQKRSGTRTAARYLTIECFNTIYSSSKFQTQRREYFFTSRSLWVQMRNG